MWNEVLIPPVPGRCRGMRWRCVVQEAAGTSPGLHRPGRQEVIAERSHCRPPSLLEGARLHLTQNPFNAAFLNFGRIAGYHELENVRVKAAVDSSGCDVQRKQPFNCAGADGTARAERAAVIEALIISARGAPGLWESAAVAVAPGLPRPAGCASLPEGRPMKSRALLRLAVMLCRSPSGRWIFLALSDSCWNLLCSAPSTAPTTRPRSPSTATVVVHGPRRRSCCRSFRRLFRLRIAL